MTGVGGALSMIALESTINLHSRDQNRARNLACYACSVGLGFAFGSSAGLHFYEIDAVGSFILGGVVTLAGVPLIKWIVPFPREEAMGVSGTLQAPFLALGSSWCQGFIEAGTLALLPLFLHEKGLSDGGSGTLIGAVLVGTLLAQIPIGWLADRIGIHNILITCFIGAGIGFALVPFMPGQSGLCGVLLLIGASSGAFYPLGLALMGERIPQRDIPRANAWFLSCNCFGSLVSPLLSGPIMKQYGSIAMFWTAECTLVSVLLIWFVLKGRGRFKNWIRRWNPSQIPLRWHNRNSN